MAHKKTGGVSRNGRDSVSKRLGFKIYGNQFVKQGGIILKQNGTRFYSGNNTGIGRDYTIYAKISGKVKFNCKYGKKYIYVI